MPLARDPILLYFLFRLRVQLLVLGTYRSRWWTVKCDAHTIVAIVRIHSSCRTNSSLFGTVFKSNWDARSCLGNMTLFKGYHFQVILMLCGEVCLSGLGGKGRSNKRMRKD